MATALVTDPRTGIGTAFTRWLGATGHDLVLAGDGERELGELAAELAYRHDITVEVMVVDLADAAERALVEERLLDENQLPVDLLVNNATGRACAGFLTTSVDRLQEEFDLKATTVLRLTHAALDGMVRRRRGAVINVSRSSDGAWGRNTVQDAFVRSLSRNLAAALHSTPVHVMALCVGAHPCLMSRSAGDEVVRRAMRDVALRKVVSGSRFRLMTDLLSRGLVDSAAGRWLTAR